MRILLLTAYFPPDTGSAAHLFYELGVELVVRGYQVTVVTNMPGYHALEGLERYQGKLLSREAVDGMDVYRVASLRLSPTSMIGRAFWQFGMALTFLVVSLFLSKHDVVLVYSPPLTLGLSALGLRLLRGTRFILNVQDLFPQSIIDLGLLNNPTIIRFFEGMERFVYRSSNQIVVHSVGNQAHVVSRGAKPEVVEVIPNWVDTEFIQPGPRLNEFRESNHFADEFLVSFAGVLGYSQDLDVILEAAEELSEYPDIHWVLVGDGVEKDRTQTKAEEMGLTDCVHFYPMLPRQKYPTVLHASDICLATLRAEVKTPVVPSKILSIMAAGKPVIAAMDLSGDAPRLIEAAECGINVNPGDTQALAAAVLRLYKDERLRGAMGTNGRAYAEEQLSLIACVSRYESMIKKVAQLT